MPLVCEISEEAYCRPSDVIRPLTFHPPDRMSPNLTLLVQLRPIFIVFSAR
jgi:hypothetical protein